MTRKVLPLDVDLLDAAPDHLRTCLSWQRPAGPRYDTGDTGDTGNTDDPVGEKRAWLVGVGADWGPPGRAVLEDGRVVACLVYAPAIHLPGAAAYPTTPVSADAVVMTCPVVRPQHRGTGLGRLLVRAMARDLLDRYGTHGSVRAVETLAEVRPTATGCAPPVQFCAAVGFGVRRSHPRHPRMRLDLRSCVSWRDEVGAAVERLRSGVRMPGAAPVPGAPSVQRRETAP